MLSCKRGSEVHADADVIMLAVALYHDRPLALQLISTEMADSLERPQDAKLQGPTPWMCTDHSIQPKFEKPGATPCQRLQQRCANGCDSKVASLGVSSPRYSGQGPQAQVPAPGKCTLPQLVAASAVGAVVPIQQASP